jgi:5'-deoxynucleotidase YfbR-like HD superfamily hydrolase
MVKMEIQDEPSQRMEPQTRGQELKSHVEQCIEPSIARQLAFLVEADLLKNVLRRTQLTDGSRQENSAEHSWHLALTAMVLEEYASAPVNLGKVLRMLIVHDLVEIDAGDTFAFDIAGNVTKEERERRAADRIFGLLPGELRSELRGLWEEFDQAATPEARFANAVDRIQPFLQNRETRGGSWRIHNLSREQVLARMDPIRTELPRLWPTVITTLEELFSNRSV